MAANSLTNIMPQILARGLRVLRERAVLPRLVTTDYGEEARQKGSTIDIPISVAQTASDVTAAPTYSSAAGGTPGLIQVPLAQWKHTDFFLTDKEMVEIDKNRHFLPLQTMEALKALGNAMDNHIHGFYTGIYGYVGTAGTTPFSTITNAVDVRKVLNTQLAPIDDRVVVLDPAAEANALALSAFSDFDKSGDQGPRIEGDLGRKLGMRWVMSQNVGTHTAGTATSVAVGSTTAAGASVLNLAVQATANNGTILIGDVFTIAGDTTTYVSQSSANLTVANVEIDISPALSAVASANAIVTLKATHVVNLAFHPQAFAFATRPLLQETADFDGGNRMMSATDPETGLSLRLEILRQYKQTVWDFDVLYGGKLVRPELAVRIAG